MELIDYLFTVTLVHEHIDLSYQIHAINLVQSVDELVAHARTRVEVKCEVSDDTH